jgi:hypothetical protein
MAFGLSKALCCDCGSVRIGVSHAWRSRRPPTPNPGTISIPKKILIYPSDSSVGLESIFTKVVGGRWGKGWLRFRRFLAVLVAAALVAAPTQVLTVYAHGGDTLKPGYTVILGGAHHVASVKYYNYSSSSSADPSGVQEVDRGGWSNTTLSGENWAMNLSVGEWGGGSAWLVSYTLHGHGYTLSVVESEYTGVLNAAVNLDPAHDKVNYTQFIVLNYSSSVLDGEKGISYALRWMSHQYAHSSGGDNTTLREWSHYLDVMASAVDALSAHLPPSVLNLNISGGAVSAYDLTQCQWATIELAVAALAFYLACSSTFGLGCFLAIFSLEAATFNFQQYCLNGSGG